MNELLKMTLPDGRTLAYAEYGDPDGAPVLCLHGTPGTRHLFSLGDASAREHGLRLIAPDRAGIGESEDRPVHSLGGHVEDFVALLDHLGVDRFAVLGFSGGGPYAAEVARRAPQRVRAVSLISAHALGLPPGLAYLLLMWLADASILVTRGLFVAMSCVAVAMPRLVGHVLCLGISRSDRPIMRDMKIRRCMTKGIAGVLWSGRATAFEARNFYRESPQGTVAMDVPVRIWHGVEDRVIAPQAALEYSKMFPKANRTMVPDAGHLWGLVHHDEILRELARDMR